MQGVYAVGRPSISRKGSWMAAVLCVRTLSRTSADSSAGLRLADRARDEADVVEVSSRRRHGPPRPPGSRVHRRTALRSVDVTVEGNIRVTSPVRTLVDLRDPGLAAGQLEAAVNAADKRDLIDPESLRRRSSNARAQPGVAAMRALLDRRTFVLTDSELERRFMPIAGRRGCPRPSRGASERVQGRLLLAGSRAGG